MPAVSVLMAVRDGAAFLPQTVASLEAQTLREVEFVVVDDASTDATPSLLEAWAARDPRTKIVTMSPDDCGLPKALNRGLQLCRAPLLSRADADDLYHPERLERQRDRLDGDRTIDVLSCSFHRIDSSGTFIGTHYALTGPERIRFTTLFQSSLLNPGAMIRTQVLRDAGGYDLAYWTAQDSDLWARLTLAGVLMDNLEEPLVSYRQHPKSIMKSRGDAGRRLSLTVPARMQAAYLGGLPSDYDVEAVIDTFQGYKRLPTHTVRRGLAGLGRITDQAAGRESGPVLAYAGERIADAIDRQVRWSGIAEPLRRYALAKEASRWRRRYGTAIPVRKSA